MSQKNTVTIDLDALTIEDRKRLWKICTDCGGYDSIVPSKRSVQRFLRRVELNQIQGSNPTND